MAALVVAEPEAALAAAAALVVAAPEAATAPAYDAAQLID